MKERMKRKIGALIMAFALVLTTVVPGVPIVWAATGTATVSNAEVKLNGENVTRVPGLVYHQGDVLEVTYNWELSNADSSTTRFEVDMSQLGIQDMNFSNTASEDLVTGGKKVGTFQIQGNKMIIELTDPDYINKTDTRSGGATIKGVLDLSGQNPVDGEEISFDIGGTTVKMIYDSSTNESSPSGGKTAQNGYTLDASGNVIKQFDVKFSAQNGYLKNVSFTDSTSSGLTNMSQITITKSDYPGITAGTTYADMAALNAAIAGITFVPGKNLDFTYTMQIDKVLGQYETNQIKIDYTSDTGDVRQTPWDVWVSLDKPSITKSGAWASDLDANGQHQVEWTIEIDLKDATVFGDWDTIVTAIKDQLGTGFVNAGAEQDIKASFAPVDGSTTKYRATYKTSVPDTIYDSKYPLPLDNTVTATIGGTDYTATGNVKTPGGKVLTKTYQNDYNATTRTMSWKLTVDPVTTDMTAVKLTDAPDNSKMIATGDIYVNGTKAASIANGVYDIIDASIVQSFGTNWNDGWVMELTDSYVQGVAASSQVIAVICTTKLKDGISVGGTTFTNNAKLDCKIGSSSVQQDASASFTSENAMTKDASATSTGAEYTIDVDLTKITGLAADNDIVITDVPDSDMQYVASSAAVSLCASWGEPHGAPKPTVSVTQGTGGLVFTIPVTADMVTYVTNGTCQYLRIQYTCQVKKSKLQDMGSSGSDNFTNQASGTYKGASIGDADKTVTVTADQYVKKKYNYTAGRSYVGFEVLLNPNALDVNPAGDRLTGIDTLGTTSPLRYLPDTVQVFTKNGDAWDVCTDYTMMYDQETNSLQFDLPDETALKIAYQAEADAFDLKAGNTITVSNTFTLKGGSGTTYSDSVNQMQMLASPTAWVTGGNTSIQLHKYWNDPSTGMTGIPGATFRVVQIDGSGNEVAGTEQSVTITDASGVQTVTGLKTDLIYKLEETASAAGFKVQTEPLYFAVLSAAGSTITTPPGIHVTGLMNTNVYFENQKANGVDVILSKTAVTGGTELNGATMALYAYNKTTNTRGARITEWKTGTSAKKSNLTEGWYELVEIAAPAGYIIHDPILFEVTAAGTVRDAAGNDIATKKIEMVDQAISDVKFSKVELTGGVSTPLADAQITLYRGDTAADYVTANIIDQWTSTTTAHVISGSRLVTGQRYTLVETITKNGYVKAENIQFTVSADGRLTNVSVPQATVTPADGSYYNAADNLIVMDDDIAVGTQTVISKVSAADDSEIEGAHLSIYKAADVVAGSPAAGAVAVASWISGEDGTDAAGKYQPHTLYLQDGDYVLIEQQAPVGFLKAAAIAFTVDGGQVKIGAAVQTGNQITMRDAVDPTYNKTSKTVKKVWNDASDQAHIRPANIRVQLYADGMAVAGSEATLDASNGWTYTWDQLTAKNGAVPIVYTAREVAVPTGYTMTVAEDAMGVTVITNTHTPDTTTTEDSATTASVGTTATTASVETTATVTTAETTASITERTATTEDEITTEETTAPSVDDRTDGGSHDKKHPNTSDTAEPLAAGGIMALMGAAFVILYYTNKRHNA